MSRAASARGPRASARLGLTLRAVLIAPREGFAGASSAFERRAAIGERPAEGATPYVLSALAGAGLMALWLKVGALFGVRDVSSEAYRWDFVAAALVLGAIVAVLSQAIWALPARAVLRTAAGRLRLVWGAASLPNVLALIVLLPLDLAIVGPDALTSERLTDPVATVWSALSISAAVSLAAWSAFLLVRGVETIASVRWTRAAAVAVMAPIVGGGLFTSIAVLTASAS